MADSLTGILADSQLQLAIIVGNGLNRYKTRQSVLNDWGAMLRKMWIAHGGSADSPIPEEITLTEFYDTLDLSEVKSPGVELQREFCAQMEKWVPGRAHENIVHWAKEKNRPLLTTNFELTLAKQAGAERYRMDLTHNRDYLLDPKKRKGFSAFYPWTTYYSTGEIRAPESEFGIWHINGMTDYLQSIRLGLTHYMGSVTRARQWLHRNRDKIEFSGKDVNGWIGHDTWLHIIFNCDLVFCGLGLDMQEVFLRWLLIERARYFRQFESRRRKGWYVAREGDVRPGKRHFLSAVGVDTVEVTDFDQIYDIPWRESLRPLPERR